MNPDELKALIVSLSSDIEFDYKGIHGSICPINLKQIWLAYGDTTADCKSIDEAMSDKLFDGKSLNEISTELEMY